MQLSARLDYLLTGGLSPLGPNAVPSGIGKQPVASAFLGETGFAGDQQGDRKRHGGAEKAVHQYPLDHYPAWRSELGDCGLLESPGAFGENLAVADIDERSVCVGDIWSLGEAVVQVSQGRQPCWRLNERFGIRDMARRVQASGRTGWYYRVLKPGRVDAGCRMRLIERPHPAWPLSRLIRTFYVHRRDPAALQAIAGLEALSESWRRIARRRLETGRLEDWSARLGES